MSAEPLHEEPKEKPTLKDIVSVLLNPQPHEQEKVTRYKELLGNLLGNHKLGRMDIVTLLAAVMEPCEVGDTELGRTFPGLIPQRPITEAWKLVAGNSGFLVEFEKRCGRQVKGEERKSVMTMRMFEAALFWDEKQGKFITYLLGSRPIRSEIAHSLDQGSGVDADGLFYSESRQSVDGERATGISARKIADPNIVNRIMTGSEAIVCRKELRAWVRKRLAQLDARLEKVLRMRYGVYGKKNEPLTRTVDPERLPLTDARVQITELDIFRKFRERGLEMDVRNRAARNADAARKRRLASR